MEVKNFYCDIDDWKQMQFVAEIKTSETNIKHTVSDIIRLAIKKYLSEDERNDTN